MFGFLGILGGLGLLGLSAGLEHHDIRKAEKDCHMFDTPGDVCPTLDQFDRLPKTQQEQIKKNIWNKLSNRKMLTTKEHLIYSYRWR